MTKIEEASIITQNNLMRDIIQNYSSIMYYVEQGGQKLRENLSTKKIDPNIPDKMVPVIFTKEVFDKMLDFAYTIQDKRKWEQLGGICKDVITENEIKIDILKQLQKQ